MNDPNPIRGYVAASQLAADEAADETARKIIATWTRGLITLAEMVTDLQKVADSEHRKALAAGAELAARRRSSGSASGVPGDLGGSVGNAHYPV